MCRLIEQQVKQGVVGAGDCAAEACLAWIFRFFRREMIGLREQFAVQGHELLRIVT